MKEQFHRKNKKLLKNLAQKLGMVKGDYEIRSNKGGNSVMGEVILHHKKLYIQIFSPYGVMYRNCEGLKDYEGGINCWCRIGDLDKEIYLNVFKKSINR